MSADNVSRIYNKAYRKYRKLLIDNMFGEENRRDVMVMLVAPQVDFDRDRTRICSRQSKIIVDRVFDNMERNGLWKDGAWLFDYGHKPDDEEDRKCLMVEFALHLLCASGEFILFTGEGSP